MKPSFSHLSKYRVRTGLYGSDDSIGRHGAFDIPHPNGLVFFQSIATAGEIKPLWEHVSVKAKNKGAKDWRCPTWAEMCFIKDLFWEENETVIQYHVSGDDLINVHPAVLHLWKPVEVEIPMPPKDYV